MDRSELLVALKEPCANCGHALGLHLRLKWWEETPSSAIDVAWCQQRGDRWCFCCTFVSAAEDDAAELELLALQGPAVG